MALVNGSRTIALADLRVKWRALKHQWLYLNTLDTVSADENSRKRVVTRSAAYPHAERGEDSSPGRVRNSVDIALIT